MKRTFAVRFAAALVGTLAFAAGAQQAPPVDFGDLIKLYRDANGVPIPTPGELAGPGLCQQPLYFGPTDLCSSDCGVAAFDELGNLVSDPVVVDVDQTTCAIAIGCEACTQEVEFGRINEARSSETVFQSQLEDVIFNLATADQVTLDSAGRLVASNCDDVTLDNLAKTIDSPLQNLAIYRELMLTGYIGAEPGIPLPGDMFDTAARGLGAASDKSGGVNVDLVHYLNKIMGLDVVPTVVGKICETYREEVQGTVQPVEKCFLNYGALVATDPLGADYSYTRSANFGALPDPAYIPEGAVEEDPNWFEYLAVVAPVDPDDPSFKIDHGPITNAVFCFDTAGDPLDPVYATDCESLLPETSNVEEFAGDNVRAFATAADDARAVIAFMHNWQVPVGYETAIPCTPSGEDSYDLLISPQSGLQVPVQMVSTTEGREFTVTVTNGGPDTGAGTVTVTADTADGGPVLADLDGDGTFTDLSPFVFPVTNLAPGTNSSRTVMFTIGEPNVRTQISWTATVVADPPEADPNPLNNSVSATTNVRTTGGGGGGQGGNPN